MIRLAMQELVLEEDALRNHNAPLAQLAPDALNLRLNVRRCLAIQGQMRMVLNRLWLILVSLECNGMEWNGME
jgi:hypothetical protein